LSTSAADRSSISKFFKFDVNNDKLETRPMAFKPIAAISVIALLLGTLSQGVGGAILFGLLGAAAAIGGDRWLAQMDVDKRTSKQNENHSEFAKLAGQTRAIQSADVLKAFLRIFDRAQIDRSKMRVLEQKYAFAKELELFSEETLSEKLGDLHDKSIRLISMGDYANPASRLVCWKETKKEEFFFNPMRLVSLFLTGTQLVICDVQIDSMQGNLKEEIQRISLNKIVSIHFSSERIRPPRSTEQLVKIAEDLGYSTGRVAEIRKDLEDASKDSVPKWSYEEMTSRLAITREDGGILSVPIRSGSFFGNTVSVLDGETALSEDEITVDRMVNELSRLVDSAN
jgi:hypothetical protein